eukprot:COSAG06_NODE_20084_length_809_cov_1.526761_1_plen_113_part_10
MGLVNISYPAVQWMVRDDLVLYIILLEAAARAASAMAIARDATVWRGWCQTASKKPLSLAKIECRKIIQISRHDTTRTQNEHKTNTTNLNLGVSRNRFCDFLADPDSRSFSRF